MTVRGTRVARREDRALLTHGGLFVADRHLPGAAHVAYVTSTMAHAHLRAVEVGAARAAPGVLDVVVAADLGGLGPERLAGPQLDAAMKRPFLATDRVRFVGEAVAAVVAETAYQAVDAVGLVEVDYEPLPAVVDPEAALATPRRGAERLRGIEEGAPPHSVTAPVLFEDASAGNRAAHLDAPSCGPTSTAATWSSTCASSTTGWRPAHSNPGWPPRCGRTPGWSTTRPVRALIPCGTSWP